MRTCYRDLGSLDAFSLKVEQSELNSCQIMAIGEASAKTSSFKLAFFVALWRLACLRWPTVFRNGLILVRIAASVQSCSLSFSVGTIFR